MARRKASLARQVTVPIRQQDGYPYDRRILAPLEADAAAADAAITALQAAVTALDGRVTQNEMDITALDGRLTTAEGAIGTLQTAVTNLQAAVAALEALHLVLTADPVSPADDDWWLVRSGTTPGSLVEVRAHINGTTYTLAGIAI